MTFEEWLEEHLDKAMKNRDETAYQAASWGHGYDSGYYTALQMVFAQLPADVAKCAAPPDL